MGYKDWIEEQKRLKDLNSDTTSKKVDDWQINEKEEKLVPKYISDFRNYFLSVEDMVSGLNTSKHHLDATNIIVPKKGGGSTPLLDWIKANGGGGGGGTGGDGGNNPNNYRLEMLSTQGNIIKDKAFSTTIKAVLYENNEDVTDDKESKYFKWARFSGATEADQIKDMEWNLKWVDGAKEIVLTSEDVDRNAMFQVQFVTEREANLWVSETYKAYQNLLNKNINNRN